MALQSGGDTTRWTAASSVARPSRAQIVNQVSNVLGASDMRIEVGSQRRIAPRDTLLIASDGLSDNLHTEEIVALLRTGPLDAACAIRGHQRGVQSARERLDQHRAFVGYVVGEGMELGAVRPEPRRPSAAGGAAEAGLGIHEMAPYATRVDREQWEPLVRWVKSKRSQP